MSRKAKTTANRVPRAAGSLRVMFLQRLRMLSAAADRWDETRSADETICMSMVLRNLLGQSKGDQLLHRYASSTDREVRFCDSAVPGWADALASGDSPIRGVGGLSVLSLDPTLPAIAPLCQAVDLTPERVQWVRFKDWWQIQTPVVLNSQRNSRRFLINEIANTDGVHVDTHLDPDYVRLVEGLDGFARSIGGDHLELARDVVGPNVRQIAWEVEQTAKQLLAAEPEGQAP